ncbi:MAG: MlaD family protein [Bacteroidales bacterium]|jgi:phospholipid/cholesterol/gamma-HCH transport system substrate-binding protein|nr:MlaD family protein [Bacteroidales bacterium]
MKKILKSTELKIALVSIAGLFLLVWGINFLKGRDIFKRQNTYYAIFENTQGLLPSHIIVVNGIKVGIVDDIKMLRNDATKVLVAMSIESKFDIPQDSRIKITLPNVFSSPQVEIMLGKSATYLNENDTLIGFTESGMLDNLDELLANLVSAGKSIDSIAASLKYSLQDGDLNHILVKIASISARLDLLLAENQSKINHIVSDVEGFTTTLKNNDPKINDIIADINEVTNQLTEAQLKGTIQKASSAIDRLDTLIANINAGEGTVGQLITNDSMYVSLNRAINRLDSLVLDIKAQPKKYINVTIFGKKEKK